VFIRYFGYLTSNSVTSVLEDRVDYPGVVACFPFRNLMKDLENITTIKDIFDSTPTANESIIGCDVLEPPSFRLVSHTNVSVCLEKFQVVKYLMGIFICYKFQPNYTSMSKDYNVTLVANALFKSHRVYDLILSSEFEEIDLLYIFTYSFSKQAILQEEYNRQHDIPMMPEFPYLSKPYGVNVWRFNKFVNMVLVRNSIVEYHELPFPFDTKCINSSQVTYHSCIKTGFLERLSRFPLEEVTHMPREIIPLRRQDFEENPDIIKTVIACIERCKNEPTENHLCERTISMTYLDYFSYKRGEGIRVAITVPESPQMKVTSSAAMDLIDLVYYISGFISFWFGLSAMSLDPGRFNINYLTKMPMIKILKRIYFEKIIRFVFIGFCCIGFVLHIYHYSSEHFAYSTGAMISIRDNNTMLVPSLMVCFSFRFITGNNSITFNTSENNTHSDVAMYSIREILDMIPPEESLLEGCGLPDEFHSALIPINKSECLEQMSVKKAVMGIKACYIIGPKNTTTFAWDASARSLTQRKEIYNLKINTSFLDSDVITVVYFNRDNEPGKPDFPVYERNYAKRFIFKTIGDDKNNILHIYAFNHHYEFLSPPYDTNCDIRLSTITCWRDCYIFRVSLLGVLPFTELYFDPYDTRMVDYNDLEKNETFMREFYPETSRCYAMCQRMPCQTDITFTEGQDYSFPDYDFYVSPYTPKAPDLKITTTPWESTITYILNLSNCIGIWFGLSVWSLNPARFLGKIPGKP